MIASARSASERQVGGEPKPRVSVVMTVYRDRRFLDASVQSILTQDLADLELIIVDDGGPPDPLLGELAQRDARVRVLVNDRNLGTATAANRGIAAARADIIARQDADDIALPTRLGRLVAFLDADPQLGLLGSSFSTISEQGERLDLIEMPLTDLEIRWRCLFSNPFCHSAVAFRRSCFEAAGGYTAGLRVLEDYDLWSRMLRVCRAANIADDLVRYRLNMAGLTATRGSDWQAAIDALRARQWEALGVPYDPAVAHDLAAFVAGHGLSGAIDHSAAYGTLLALLRSLLTRAGAIERPSDRADRSWQRLLARILTDRSLSTRSLMSLWRVIWTIDPSFAARSAPRLLRRVVGMAR
jgi:glycosyltransferase involved in cell wall biosynthesis